MPTPAILDLEPLLAPISEESPTGPDLRENAEHDSPYYRIREARQEAGVLERNQPGDRAATLPAWGMVADLSLATLQHQSKDIRFAAYAIEALLRTNGIAGLRDGFKLTRELVERYWDKLHPMPDEDGLATRVASLVGLNGDSDREGTLIDPINALPFTSSTHLKNYSFADYVDAVNLETLPDAVREKKLAQGAVTLEQIRQSVADTPAAFYHTLRDDLTACLDEFKLLSQSLGKRCGHDTPSASSVRGALQSGIDVVLQMADQKLKQVVQPVVATPTKGGGGAASPFEETVVQTASGPIRTRDDAFRQLESVAQYFRTHEPHTVISYTLEQVVRWGRMPLPELLVELIPDDAVRQALFRQVGIKAPPPSEGGEQSSTWG